MARKSYNELDYAAAVARLSALETRLLGLMELDKLIHATSTEDAVKSLANLGFKTSDDFNKMLEYELLSVFTLIESIGGEDFLKTQRIKYDYHNLKVLIKADLTNQECDDLLMDIGTMKLSDLKSAVLNREYRILTESMQEMIPKVYDQYARTKDVQQVDVLLDSALFRDMFAYAKSQPEEKILHLIQMQIDIFNILTFIRVRKMGKSHTLMEKAVVDGGLISSDFYIKQIGVSDENLSGLFTGTPYTKAFIGNSNLELELDNVFMAEVKKARRGAFGLAPIAAYFWLKENEIRNLRIILTCKNAGIQADIIRSKLRGQ